MRRFAPCVYDAAFDRQRGKTICVKLSKLKLKAYNTHGIVPGPDPERKIHTLDNRLVLSPNKCPIRSG